MERVLLTVIAASGLCAVWSQATRQYHFVYELKNMADAQKYCREKYTDLATIRNIQDVDVLNKMADVSQMEPSGDGRHRAWIGLVKEHDGWAWTNSDRSFREAGETEFTHWQPGEPNNAQGDENCVEMDRDGKWNDAPCHCLYKAVCCDLTGSQVKYFITDENMTWNQAWGSCRQKYTDLASVRNYAENQKVNALIPEGQRAWIGLYKGPWKWADGRTASFWHWGPSEPNNLGSEEECVVAYFDNYGQWEDWNCKYKFPFICYSQTVVTRQMIKLTLQTEDSSVDLNDPMVMERMLEQLTQKLKDQGVSEHVKLSFTQQPDGKVFHRAEEEPKKRTDEISCPLLP